ncbi:MAG: hypothetical protein AAGI24_04120 [Pseudomonadota bacterium]
MSQDFAIPHTTVITARQVEVLLTNAIEDASKYWIQAIESDGTGHPATELALNSKDMSVQDFDSKWYPINRHRLTRTLDLMQRNYPKHWNDLTTGNDDAETADVFLQLAAFGEITYS